MLSPLYVAFLAGNHATPSWLRAGQSRTGRRVRMAGYARTAGVCWLKNARAAAPAAPAGDARQLPFLPSLLLLLLLLLPLSTIRSIESGLSKLPVHLSHCCTPNDITLHLRLSTLQEQRLLSPLSHMPPSCIKASDLWPASKHHVPTIGPKCWLHAAKPLAPYLPPQDRPLLPGFRRRAPRANNRLRMQTASLTNACAATGPPAAT